MILVKHTVQLRLPLYEVDDVASLVDGYNEAMRIIDTEFSKLLTRVSSLELKYPNPKITDADVTAQDISHTDGTQETAGLKKTTNGWVYVG